MEIYDLIYRLSLTDHALRVTNYIINVIAVRTYW